MNVSTLDKNLSRSILRRILYEHFRLSFESMEKEGWKIDTQARVVFGGKDYQKQIKISVNFRKPRKKDYKARHLNKSRKERYFRLGY